MKNAIIVICITLLAMHSMLIDARKIPKKGTMASPEKLLEIKKVIQESLSPKCREAIERYGKSTNTMERNCYLVEKYEKFLGHKGCTADDHDKLWAVLECDGGSSKEEYQAEKDVTDATPGAAGVTQGITNTISSANNGSRGASNVTKASP